MNEVDRHAILIWDYMLLHHKLTPADVIIVLGSHDLGVAQWAADVYHQGLAPKVLVTGGRGRITQASEKSESETYLEILMAAEIDPSAILIEPNAQNTGENVLLSRTLLAKNNLNVKKVIVVTKPYMERRAWATFKARWPEVDVQVTSQTISYEGYIMHSTIGKQQTLSIMVGDLQRIMEYPTKGWMVEQDVPHDVRKAYDWLVAQGYTHQLA